MKNIASLTLGEIVTANYKTANVFEKHKIDFCCQGRRTLHEACDDANLDLKLIESEINALEQGSNAIDFTQWPLDLLVDYIQRKHHGYIEQATPVIKNLLDKICSVHGVNHPELIEIRSIFLKTSGELAVHMKKEELILFPFIKKLVADEANSVDENSILRSSVVSPISKLEDDHLNEGEQLELMAKLSNNFTPPQDACITYTTTYKMLKEYEQDMHLHIHLENNILFQRAIRLENELRISKS